MRQKRGVMFLIVLLLVLPLIYAANYGSGTYGVGVYGIGEVAAVEDTGDITNGPSSRGGGSAQDMPVRRMVPIGEDEEELEYECYTDYDCAKDQYCFDHSCYDAECYSNDECTAPQVCWNLRCVKLFDIEIVDFQSPIKLGDFFEFTYFLKGMADINDDVVVRFYIEKEGKPISTGSDTFYMASFEEKTKTTKLFLPSDMTSGVYDFRVQIIYGAYSADSHRTIEIEVDGGMAKISGVEIIQPLSINLISILIGLAAFILALVFYIERKKIKKGIIVEALWIKKHKISILVFFLLVVLGVLAYFLDWLRFVSNKLPDVILWCKTNLLPVFKKILASVVHYSSPSNPYFYYVLGSIFILVAVVILLVVIKSKKPSVEKRATKEKKLISVKMETPKVEDSNVEAGNNEKKEIPVKKIKKGKLKIWELFGKHKTLSIIALAVIILAAIVTYLFYSEILTLEQLQNLWETIAEWVSDIAKKLVPSVKSVWNALCRAYSVSLNWLKELWVWFDNWAAKFI